jgi:hypothetical protein
MADGPGAEKAERWWRRVDWWQLYIRYSWLKFVLFVAAVVGLIIFDLVSDDVVFLFGDSESP